MGSRGCSPRPKSPPELYGKRRELAKVVMLEREIGFLKEELKSIEKLQPASFCIKEVADYVSTNPEPLITLKKKTRKTCRFWKWLCGNSCFNMSWICCCCCCSGCSLKTAGCCGSCSMPDCCSCSTPDCCSCSMPECCSCSLPKCGCNCKPRCPPCLKECLKECLCCCPKCDCSCYPKCSGCSCSSSCKCCFSCWPTKCSCPKLPKCSSCRCCSLNCFYACCQCC